MAVRGILWDIGDTVFDYTGAEGRAIEAYAAEQGLTDRFGRDGEALARWREVMAAAYERFLSGELSFAEHRRVRVREFLEEELDDVTADAWIAGYTVRCEEAWTVFADVVPALDYLTVGYRHGLLSNSSRSCQDRKLRTLGLRDRFACLVCSDEVGAAKPDPVIFLAGCEALGLPPEQVAYVGDRLDTDALGAQAAGLLGVWLDRAGEGFAREPPAGVHRVTGLGTLAAVLEGAGRAHGPREGPESRFGAAPPIG